MFYDSVDRIPIGMYVGYVHENGYHKFPFVEIFLFVHFLYNNDSSVCRCDNNFFRVLLKVSDRATEEIYHQQIKDNADSG